MVSFRRRVADGLGRMLDAHVVARSGADYWPERRFVERMFARLRPDCVFDVGANGGQYAKSLRDQGYAGTILSFEPNPDAYARLARVAAGDPRWHCLPLALGSARGKASFNVMAEDVFSSFHRPVEGPDADFAAENRISRTVEVDVERLDAILPRLAAEHGFATPFLKMDTQGFDLEVFRGAGAEAHRFCALLSEVSVRRLYDGAPDMTESLATFRDGGFELAALHSVHAVLPLRAIEFNCYCVRRDLAAADRPD